MRAESEGSVAAPATWPGVLLCGLIALVASAPVLFGDYIFENVDLHLHYRWASQFAGALEEGVVYPRWTPAAYNGIGEPVYLYYPPAYAFLVGTINLAVDDVWLSMKLTGFLITWLIGAAAFLVGRRLGLGRYSLLLAGLFVFAPPILGEWIRIAAMASYTADAFALVTVYLLIDPAAKRRWIDPRLVLAFAATVFAHALTGFMLILAAPFAALRRLKGPRDGWDRVWHEWLRYGFSMGLGVALAGVYMVPAVLGLQYIDESGWDTYVRWEHGFLLPLYTWLQHGLKWFQVQWVNGGLVAGMFGLGILYLLARGRERDRTRVLMLGLTGIGGLALFLGTELSYWLWSIPDTILRKLQQPKRLIVPLALAALPLLAIVFADVRRRRDVRWRAGFRYVSLAAVVATVAVTGLLHAQHVILGMQPDYHPGIVATQYGRVEYVPASRGPDYREYVRELGGFAGECEQKGVAMTVVHDRSHDRRWTLETDEPVTLRIGVWDFPGWTVWLDGEEIPRQRDPGVGVLLLDLPAGRHTLTAKWTGVPEQTWGLATSLLAAAVLAGAWVRQRRRTAEDA